LFSSIHYLYLSSLQYFVYLIIGEKMRWFGTKPDSFFILVLLGRTKIGLVFCMNHSSMKFTSITYWKLQSLIRLKLQLRMYLLADPWGKNGVSGLCDVCNNLLTALGGLSMKHEGLNTHAGCIKTTCVRNQAMRRYSSLLTQFKRNYLKLS
jgi:hypothetical protein